MNYLTTADIWRIALLLLAGISTFIAFWVSIQALFPNFIRRAQAVYSRPWRMAGVGVLTVVILAALGSVLLKVGKGGQFIASVGGAVALVLALAGSAGLARKIGSGMQHPSDKDQPWRRTLRGGITLGGLLLVPILNFVPAVALLVSGLGASLLSLRGIYLERKQAKAEAVAEEAELHPEDG
jgi:hypothetical protein